MKSNYSYIEFQIEKSVAKIKLNRPERHNALILELISELDAALEQIRISENVDFIVLSGNGLSFCAGADLNWFSGAEDFTLEISTAHYKKFADLLLRIYRLPQITIAQVHGNVFGGGLGLMAVCDFVLTETKTRFMLSELKLGLLPAIITPFLSKRMNAGYLRSWILTSRLFDVNDAEKAGLADKIYHEKESEQALNSFISKFSACSPIALKQAKILINKVISGEVDVDDTHITSEILAKALLTDDGKEGIQAFLEKRNPKWYKA